MLHLCFLYGVLHICFLYRVIHPCLVPYPLRGASLLSCTRCFTLFFYGSLLEVRHTCFVWFHLNGASHLSRTVPSTRCFTFYSSTPDRVNQMICINCFSAKYVVLRNQYNVFGWSNTLYIYIRANR